MSFRNPKTLLLSLGAGVSSWYVYKQSVRKAYTATATSAQADTPKGDVKCLSKRYSSLRVETPAVELEMGVTAIQGKRDHMEDEFVFARDITRSSTSEPDVLNGELGRISAFGVFDGHGGERCSAVTRRVVLKYLSEAIDDQLSTQAFARAFYGAENAYVATTRVNPKGREGSTITLGVIDQSTGELVVANAGDSRCVLCRKASVAAPSPPRAPLSQVFSPSVPSGEETPKYTYQGQSYLPDSDMSIDNKPARPDEKARIEGGGGRVWRRRFDGCPRIYWVEEDGSLKGGLAVARGIGDKFYQRGNTDLVPAYPELRRHRIDLEKDSFVIFATDGLWDVMDGGKACAIARNLGEKASAQAVSKELVDVAYKEGSTDNITVLALKLKKVE